MDLIDVRSARDVLAVALDELLLWLTGAQLTSAEALPHPPQTEIDGLAHDLGLG